MESLRGFFDYYFSPGELNVTESWIIDSFTFHVNKLPDDESCTKDLIDLSKVDT